MKVIVYTRPDGGVSVCRPVISKDDPKGFTTQNAIDRALAKDIPADAADAQVIDAAMLPSDRTFRRAWRASAGRVNEALPEAKVIAEEKVPAKAAEIRAAKDVPALRSLVRP